MKCPTIALSKNCSVLVMKDLEDLLGLTVVPLLDAREGLKEISVEEIVEDLTIDPENQEAGLMERELEKAKNNEKFQNLIKKHEAATSGEEVSVPPLYVYSVPEDKNSDNYEDSKKQRLSE